MQTRLLNDSKQDRRDQPRRFSQLDRFHATCHGARETQGGWEQLMGLALGTLMWDER